MNVESYKYFWQDLVKLLNELERDESNYEC